MKKELCEAFCQTLDVVLVPAGLAVGTAFLKEGGDRIGFFVVGPDKDGRFVIQDDGATVPYLEAAGADLAVQARADAFHALLREYGAIYDDESCELTTEPVPRESVAGVALQFVALLLRVQDLLLLTRERAESTWIEEAARELSNAAAGRAEIEFNAAVAPELSAYPADVVLRVAHRDPVAVFFGSSDSKVYEALLLHTYARYQARIGCPVVVLLERDKSVTHKARQRADNNLIVPRYRGGEAEAIGRIMEEAAGPIPSVH